MGAGTAGVPRKEIFERASKRFLSDMDAVAMAVAEDESVAMCVGDEDRSEAGAEGEERELGKAVGIEAVIWVTGRDEGGAESDGETDTCSTGSLSSDASADAVVCGKQWHISEQMTTRNT